MAVGRVEVECDTQQQREGEERRVTDSSSLKTIAVMNEMVAG